MKSFQLCPVPTLSAGAVLHGFDVIRVEQIPDIGVTAYEMEHKITGAKVLHLHSNDTENLYAIGFRTPPFDSTGVPHILEHSVLAGSERYPLKDAFNELLKGTLQTFINAFTYPDKTLYPVASQIKADYYNLARVYTDLVLRPRLLKETFLQEGHHLEFVKPDDVESDLTVSGVVFNEMKGAYSSPDSLMYKIIQENLYPDTTYACDSGGNPDDIPSLTYEQFTAFHHRYYSPSNARIFLFGDIPTADHLAFLEEMLAGFARVEVDSQVLGQPRWRQPAAVRGYYPVGMNEELGKKTAVNIAWMMADNTDYEAATLLAIVSGLLVGNSASPLRKALIDSGLGEDLSPVTGIEPDLRQIAFAVGLRGTDAEAASAIESLIMGTLKKLAEEGFDRELIEGTLHQVEFHGKEIVRKTMPYGITLMSRAYHTWLYDSDPLVGLNFPQIIERVREQWKQNPALFQDIVRTWFLENPHRLLSVMEPSKTYQKEREDAFRKRMADLQSSLSREELETIRDRAASLVKYQSEPDTPEAAASLPRLKTADISREADYVPTEMKTIDGVSVLAHDIFTNGIAYLDFVFDVADVPEALQPFLPLLGKLMTNMGAAGFSYEDMAKRITLKTGGLSFSTSCGIAADGSGGWQKMIVSVKSLYRNLGDTVGIMTDVLTKADFSNEARMKDLLVEKKNRLHAAVVPSGHLFAKMVAGAGISTPAYRDEQWHGRTQLRFLTAMASSLGEEKENILEKIGSLYRTVIGRKRLIINMTADPEGMAGLSAALPNLLNALPEGGIGKAAYPSLSPVCVGISVPAEVSYVAEVMNAPTYKDRQAPYLLVLAKYLSNNFLYKRVRVQGGAYGGMSLYDPLSGLFSFLSYRDPRIAETLRVYDEAKTFLDGGTISAEEIEKAVIGTIGSLDRPMDPYGRGHIALIRHLAGLTDTFRRGLRKNILDATSRDILGAASCVLSPGVVTGRTARAVLASEENLLKANRELEDKLNIELLAD
jgi:presequence protease